MRWLAIAAVLLLVMAAGAAARSLRWLAVFRGDEIVFPLGDAYYHLRRAEFTLERPGEILLYDPLVNHPDGSWVPWPPLHTVALLGTTRLLGGTKHALELAGAWYPVAIGAATALPVFGAARCVAGPGVALGAAALALLFPAGVAYSDVGNADHHCTVSFFVALWLFGALASARRDARGPRGAAAAALLAAGRLGVVFSWPGSILYLALGDGALVAIAILRGRARLLAHVGLGLVASALATAAVVPRLGPPVGGAFSTIALSFLQPAAMSALAFVALASAALERRWPDRIAAARVAGASAAALFAGAALLALPGLLDGLREAAGFVGKGDPWAAFNAEQRPLLPLGTPGACLRPLWYFGGFAYAIPVLPLWLAWRARREAEPDAVLLLAVWTAAIGALAASQIRYGADYAPVAGVGFAVALGMLARAVGGRRGRATAAVVALAGAAPLVAQTGAQAQAAWAGAHAPQPPGDPLLVTATGSLYRFAEEIRRVTPPVDGYFDPAARPAYGILSPANVGHLLHYVAHAATPSDNFGPYAGSRHFARAQGFFRLRDESRAVEVAESLGAPYVLTLEYGPVADLSLVQRLHREDGVEREDAAAWERFRLVTEGPRGGRALTELYGGRAPQGVAPFKLFELVPGALLEVHAEPGAQVQAFATIRTPLGRDFDFPIHRRADASGVARIRVPYATDGAAPTGALEAWQVSAGGRTRDVAVPEAAVREGGVVSVDLAAGAP